MRCGNGAIDELTAFVICSISWGANNRDTDRSGCREDDDDAIFDENLFAEDFMSVLNRVWSQCEVVAA